MRCPCLSIRLEKMAAGTVRLTTSPESVNSLALKFRLGEIPPPVTHKMGDNDA